MEAMANLKNNITEVNTVRSFQWRWRHSTKQFLIMPIKVKPYFHQKKAFDFACNKFGITAPYITSSAKKEEMLSRISDIGFQVVVVNYESAWRIQDALEEFGAELIIADEGHKIKKVKTERAKCLHYLGDRAKYKLLLAEKLITNYGLDVFSQYRYLNQKVFGDSFYRFRNMYLGAVVIGNHIPIFRSYIQENFLQKMHSIAFRVTKDECLDLPEITEEVREIELEPNVMKMYQEIEKESHTRLQNSEVSAINALAKLLRLSQLTGGYLTDDFGECKVVSMAKLSVLENIVDLAITENKKLAIMARFVAEINDIQEMLKKKGICYATVRGRVKNRSEEIRRFQENDKCMIFIGQIAATGLEITLTAASTMVFYSMDYSMLNFEQAKACIHRVGQKNNCYYIYLIAEGTVDRKILKSLSNKEDMAKALIDDYKKDKRLFKR